MGATARLRRLFVRVDDEYSLFIFTVTLYVKYMDTSTGFPLTSVDTFKNY